ncbi:MAG: energy-coupling factor transporter transmembrane protein EcfT [Chloroflexi bacterium]|nr:energy-coupling factor transporter transmembrane protein EcfT [Chloroflexota bacterium]MCI0643419.1 energy-coupling factor transporter transmembrane protein EcfT [Chloroflexota bacterium]MCI0731035.1 energy-coupling factor transporter transmembrane protein EcfT [Chloroflexota bacterium]
MNENHPSYNPRAWLVWVLAAALLVMVARNPLYTVILLLVSQVALATRAAGPGGRKWPFWSLGLFIVLVSAVYNSLFVHVGQTVLLRLPAGLPLLGGPVTLEAMVAGAANGLVLLALLSVFTALNALVPAGELVRLMPAALHDLGLVILIALTYVPETGRHLQRIREAQAIRGHRLRGLRDWRPVVIPLLVGGLERSLQLAEAMVARGYGATAGAQHSLAIRLVSFLGLLAAFTGWLLAYWLGWPGWLLLAAGAGVLAGLLWVAGRRSPRSQYRPLPWRPRDSLLVAVALLPLLVALLPWPFVAQGTLAYSPYPRVHMPAFDPFIGLALAALVLPALWL